MTKSKTSQRLTRQEAIEFLNTSSQTFANYTKAGRLKKDEAGTYAKADLLRLRTNHLRPMIVRGATAMQE